MGIAREEPEHYTISVDLNLYGIENYKDFPDYEQGTDAVHQHQTANLAVGYEQFLKQWLSLRGGFFTNLTSSDSPDEKSGYRQLDHINMYGFSANFSIRPHEQTSFTFGGYYSGGTGLSTQLVGNQIRVVPKSQQIFTMLIGTGFHF